MSEEELSERIFQLENMNHKMKLSLMYIKNTCLDWIPQSSHEVEMKHRILKMVGD